MKGDQLHNLNDLAYAVKCKRAIETHEYKGFGHQGYIPASWVFNMGGSVLHSWFQRGMHLYDKKPKV